MLEIHIVPRRMAAIDFGANHAKRWRAAIGVDPAGGGFVGLFRVVGPHSDEAVPVWEEPLVWDVKEMAASTGGSPQVRALCYSESADRYFDVVIDVDGEHVEFKIGPAGEPSRYKRVASFGFKGNVLVAANVREE